VEAAVVEAVVAAEGAVVDLVVATVALLICRVVVGLPVSFLLEKTVRLTRFLFFIPSERFTVN
jgi:hypothetical protein